MLNLSDTVGYFIEYHFTDQQKILLLDGFSVLETFSYAGGFYEDKYIDIVSNETITNDTKHIAFFIEMQNDIINVISLHGIKINPTQSSDLSVLLEIVNGLILLANLEDYSEVAYRVHGTASNRKLVIDILNRYTTLSMVKLMDCVDSVDSGFIDTLRNLSEPALHETTDVLDTKHRQYISDFFEFTENTPCLGLTLINSGYKTNLTLEELLNLLPYDTSIYFEKEASRNLTQVGLDVLSLLVITKDDYNLPLFKIKKSGHLITSDLLLLSRISNVIFKIMEDFSLKLEAKKQGEHINDN